MHIYHFVFRAMVEIAALPYAKMVLHSLKYPQYTIRGVLLGRVRNAEAINNEADLPSAVDIKVVDAIPAFHNNLVVPTVETLMIHLDSYCQDERLKIVGLYFANQRFNDNSFDELWGRVAIDKLKTPLVIQIENAKLSVNSTSSCLSAFYYDGKWKPETCRIENAEETISLASIAMQNKLYRDLVDFENHLDQPQTADFFNTDLNLKIESSM